MIQPIDLIVIPAKAGIYFNIHYGFLPAFAGMTL